MHICGHTITDDHSSKNVQKLMMHFQKIRTAHADAWYATHTMAIHADRLAA